MISFYRFKKAMRTGKRNARRTTNTRHAVTTPAPSVRVTDTTITVNGHTIQTVRPLGTTTKKEAP